MLTLVIRGTGNAGGVDVDVDVDGVGLGDALAEVDGDVDLAGDGLAEADGEAPPLAGWVSGDVMVIAAGPMPAAIGPG